MTTKPTIFALDFGTTNSLLSAAAPGRTFSPVALDGSAQDPTILRSVLHFTSADDVVVGHAALRRYVDSGLSGRLLRSIKRHLGSPSLDATRIDGRRITIEDITAFFLRAMRERACHAFDTNVDRVLLGRPARFSERVEDDARAEARLYRAARTAGFRDVWFCYEPVAAAHDFVGQSTRPRLVLIADLGGGTSDFTVVRMDPTRFRQEDVLAVGGVAVAGDALDGAVVRSEVAPLLGSNAAYRLPATKNVLKMPGELLQLLCSPARLTLADRRMVLERIDAIRRGLLVESDAQRLSRFATLISDAVGYQFYESVEAAKVRLSQENEVTLSFPYPGIELDHPITRAEFEAAIAWPLEHILGALDQTLATAGIAPTDIEIACLTGGTSLVPILEAILRTKLRGAKVVRLRSHHSVVQGLAQCAQALEDGTSAPGLVQRSPDAANSSANG